MHNQKLAVAIKSSNKVLREFEDTVYVPFGSEYSILIKNLNTQRARVSITIDGTDVLDGSSLIVDANDNFELERYIKSGNLSTGNRFKFIERTASIEQHRGVDISDGLIRVEFQYEQPNQPAWNGVLYRSLGCNTSNAFYSKSCADYSATTDFLLHDQPREVKTSAVSQYSSCINSVGANSLSAAPVAAEVGITVPGSISDQQFRTVTGFIAEPTKHVMVFKMMGVAEDVVVSAPITVKHKPKCVTCGHVNKAKSKFCSECGTSLTIL